MTFRLDGLTAGDPVPFVGRGAELVTLTEALERSLGGTSTFACIVGEPGIGKTRLAEEVVGRARRRGCAVGWGRCAQSHEGRPLWPWRQVLRGSRDAELSALGGRLNLPALGTETEDARADAFDAIADALVGAAAREPQVLVFDDLHWCDLPSAALLELVARRVRDARLLLLTTWRDTDLELRPDLARPLHRLARDSRRVLLGGLDEGAIDQYLQANHTRSVAAAEVLRRTAGNPFFMSELVAAATARAGKQARLPGSIRAAVSERIADLGGDERAVLEVLAVADEVLTVAQLAEVLARPSAAVRDAIAKFEGLGLVRHDEPEPPRFIHEVVRESLYDGLTADRRRALHLATADALAATANAEENADLVARHGLAADDPGRRAWVVDWGRRAARGALLRGAHEAAAELLSRLLGATTSQLDDDTDLHAMVAAELAEASMYADDRERGLAACERAAQLARDCGSARALAVVALARGIHAPFGRVDPQHVALLQEALSMQGAEQHESRALLMARLATAMQPAEDPLGPLELAREAVALARRVGRPEVLARTLSLSRGTFRPLEDLHERTAMDEEILELAAQARDRWVQVDARHRLALLKLEAGDSAAASAHARAHAELAEQLGSRRLVGQGLLLSAALATVEGDVPEARRRWERGTAMTPASAAVRTMLQRLVLVRWWGDRELLADTLALAEVPWPLRTATANALVALGRLDEARELVDTALAPGWTVRYLTLVGLAEPCAAVGSATQVASMYAALRPFEDRHAVWWGSPGGSDGSLSRHLALLAARMGDATLARHHFERALGHNLELGAPILVARTREEYGRFLLAHADGPGTRARASELLDAATRAYRARGMTLDLERVSVIADDRPSPSRASVGPPVVGPTADPPVATAIVLEQRGETWLVRWGGSETLVTDSDGMRYLAFLVERPDTDVHVLELVGVSRARRRSSHDAAAVAGDVGPALDARAKSEYRRRIEDLREQLEQASAWSDSARAEALEDELEQLTRELTRAVGLGGRDRPQRAAAERARANVTQRIRRAIAKIREQDAALGHELDRAIRTGTLCRYGPPPSS